MEWLSAHQLKRCKQLMQSAAHRLCAAINQSTQRLSHLDDQGLSQGVKGALLREVITRLAHARGLLSAPSGGSFTGSARLLLKQGTLPELPLLCGVEGFELIEPQLSSTYEAYTRELSALEAELSWGELTESTLGAIYEPLTGYHVRRVRELSCALRCGRGELRWLSLSELRRLLAKPTPQSLRESLGLSLRQAQRALKRGRGATRPPRQLKRAPRATQIEGYESLQASLSLAPSLAICDEEGAPLIAVEGDLVWEPSGLRRLRGAHYTPWGLACEAVTPYAQRAWEQAQSTGEGAWREALCQARLCDPAVGGGVFLIEYTRALLREASAEGESAEAELRGELVSRALFGVDLDPLAIEVTRASLWLLAAPSAPLPTLNAHLRCGDSLSAALNQAPWAELRAAEGFDFVICNPPYLNGIERDLKSDLKRRRRYEALYPHSSVGAYDSFEQFWERCCQLLSPRGRYALLVPTVQLSHEGAFKRWLHEEWRPTHIKLHATRSFSAARVRTALIRGQRGQAARVSLESDDPHVPLRGVSEAQWSAEGHNWFTLFSQASAPLGLLELRVAQTLAERFTVNAGCATGAAYELRGQIREQARSGGGAGPILITTGLIERYHHLWGERRARYLKKDYRHPRWPSSPSAKSLSAALERQRGPKVLVAGLSAVLEALCDELGACAGVVQTWVVRPSEALPLEAQVVSCELLCVYLNSAALSYHFVARYGAMAMSGRQITLKKRALMSFPLPEMSSAEELVALLAQRSGELMRRCRQLCVALKSGAELSAQLQGLSQLERDGLKVITHRALTAQPSHHELPRAELDRLAHLLVSASYRCPGAPLVAWWRARAGLDK